MQIFKPSTLIHEKQNLAMFLYLIKYYLEIFLFIWVINKLLLNVFHTKYKIKKGAHNNEQKKNTANKKKPPYTVNIIFTFLLETI